MSQVDPEAYDQVAKAFGISEALAREIEYQNDDFQSYMRFDDPEARWTYMRNWVESKIKKEKANEPA